MLRTHIPHDLIAGTQIEFNISNNPGAEIFLNFSIDVENLGQASSRASMTVELIADGFFGDETKYSLNSDGITESGEAASLLPTVSVDYPSVVLPGATVRIGATTVFPAIGLRTLQEQKIGFNWWVGRITVFDHNSLTLAAGDPLWTIRDWFRVV